MKDLIRTTSFWLPPEAFGRVYAYRAGERFLAAWKRVEEAKRLAGERQLPFASLATALRILTGDFVRLKAGDRRDSPADYFFVSRERLTPEVLVSALLAWESAMLPDSATGDLADAVDDLHEERRSVADAIRRRIGGCPDADPWVWNAAVWSIAHRLCEEPMRLDNDRMVRLRFDTEADLLTWEAPVVFEGRQRSAKALHVVTPRLITVPGLEEPVIHLDARLVRLTDTWSRAVRYAWVERDSSRPLLCLPVARSRRPEDERLWADLTSRVLQAIATTPLKEPKDIDLAREAGVCARLGQSPPPGFPIGKGPGQMFHEAVALHARRLLREASPITLKKSLKTLPVREKASLDASMLAAGTAAARIERLRIVCLYANDELRKRLSDTFEAVAPGAGAGATDDVPFPIGSVEVVFTTPPGSKEILVRNGDAATIREWTHRVVHRWRDGASTLGILAETTAGEDRETAGEDPKFVIRQALAAEDLVSQFIAASSAPEGRSRLVRSEPKKDYAASRALWDLLRSLGVFPQPFPSLAPRISDGTWMIGLHFVKRRDWNRFKPRKPWEGFIVSAIAARSGTREAVGLAPDGRWKPVGLATAQFLSVEHNLDKTRAAQTAESAVSQLLASDPLSAAVLFVNAEGQDRLWPVLKDTGTAVLPAALTNRRLAVIRVRADEHQIPRPSGKGPWPRTHGPGKPRTVNALLV